MLVLMSEYLFDAIKHNMMHASQLASAHLKQAIEMVSTNKLQ